MLRFQSLNGFISLILFLSFFSCNSDQTSKRDIESFSFTKLDAAITNIDFVNKLLDDPSTDRNILSYNHYYNGAGVGIGDFNNDGKEDIFFAGNEVDNRLYINKGALEFEDITSTAGINANKNWCSGVSVVDINNDGFDDIYVCQQGPTENYAERRNLLYINNGDLTFTEQAEAFGLDDGNQSTQAVFFDYDKDGDLDCYVLNESKYVLIALNLIFEDLKKKENLEAASGNLFENTGDNKFKRVTEEAGMLKHGFGLGVVVTDINEDGWPDLYVSNDYSVPDYMYINQMDGTFKDELNDRTKQISFYGMGCDAADFNNDGHIDLCVVDMAADDHYRDKTLMASMDTEVFWYYINNLGYQSQYMFNSLQLNIGDGNFSNIANLAGVARSDWSWASLFVDVNLDGNKDLFVSNGFRRYPRDNDFKNRMQKIRDENGGTVPLSMRNEVYKLLPVIDLPNKMYLNDGKLGFTSVEESVGLDVSTFSYGAAFADFDNDGDQDLIVNNIDQEAMLFTNNASDNANYIKIGLSHKGNPADILGSKVSIYTSDGQMQFQEYYFVRGYESSMGQELVFGLSKNKKINRIEIIWPDGNVQNVANPAINQKLVISYKKEGAKRKDQINESSQLFASIPVKESGLDFKHSENSFNDFEKEVLLPQKQSTLGPALASGDINNDGLEDIYIGGASGQPGAMYLQRADGKMERMDIPDFALDIKSEDVNAYFFDPNKDGLLDLLVLSGGGGDMIGNEGYLQDRFYANIGGGVLRKVGNALPQNLTSSYAAQIADINKDGNEEIILTTAAIPGKYPMTSGVFIYEMAPNNLFLDKTKQFLGEESFRDGLYKDVAVQDVNDDGSQDMILVGEWTPVKIMISVDGKFEDHSDKYISNNKNGWWYSISSGDFDNDGDIDFVLGNVSKNFKQKASEKKPLYLYANDFDDSGSMDVVLGKHYEDRIVPARGRECSSEQMPFIQDKFETYKSFADASIEEILGVDKISESISLKATDFASYFLWNENGKFVFDKMPSEAQVFPILDSEVLDIDENGTMDIVLTGNIYNTEVETPRLDAGNGLVLINEGKRSFKTLTPLESGFYTPGNAKRIIKARTNNGYIIVVANNDGALEVFRPTD